jgi:urease accessory protein
VKHAAVRHAPSLRVSPGGVAAASSGSFTWIVHRRQAPVAFLATPLMALGDGEELHVSVELEAGASAALTGQGPTTLLRTGQRVVQRWRIRVGEDAHLTLLPWVTIPFPGSRSWTEVHVELADGATLCAWDLLAVGRVGRGERFVFDELRSSWRILRLDAPLLDERLLVRGGDQAAAEAMLAGRSHVGSLFLAGFAEKLVPLALVREALDTSLDLAGASQPAPGLVVARALERSADRLEQAFWPLVSAARTAVALPRLDPGHVARRWFGTGPPRTVGSDPGGQTA